MFESFKFIFEFKNSKRDLRLQILRGAEGVIDRNIEDKVVKIIEIQSYRRVLVSYSPESKSMRKSNSSSRGG